MVSSVENYFEYINKVLGIHQILARNEISANTTEAAKKNIQLLISVNKIDSYTTTENDLLQKMVSALKLDDNNFIIADESLKNNFSASFELAFVDSINGNTEFNSDGKVIVYVHSPRILMQQPLLKKQAWSDMQTLLQKIKLAQG